MVKGQADVQQPGSVAHLRPGEGRTRWLLGERYTIKVTGEETGGAFALVEQTCPPATAGPPPHRHHPTDETFYVLEGELEFWAEGATVRAGAGSVIRVPRGILHTYRPVSATPAKQVVMITPAGFEQFFVEAGEPTDSSAGGEPPNIGRLLEIGQKHDLEVPPLPDA